MVDIPRPGIKLDEYLDARHHLAVDIDQNINDAGRLIIQGGIDTSLREIICTLLSGGGLKLPNLQICLSVNLKAILGVEGISNKLKSALAGLDRAFDNFMAHTKLDSVLGRLDDAVSEITNIANMLNFCSAPLVPISITNLLENKMQSFLGKGKELIDRIGRMIPDQIGGCLGFDGQSFNRNLFNGGILGDISARWDDIIADRLTDSEIDTLVTRIETVTREVDELIQSENEARGVVSLGGSQFPDLCAPSTTPNTDMGVLHNPQSSGIQGNTRIASTLKSTFDRLAGYPIVDNNGKVYENIFQLFLDDCLIELLRRPSNPQPFVGERVPVFNYCGDIIGYTTNVVQQEAERSLGKTPATITEPGFLANGLDTESLNVVPLESQTTTNTTTTSTITPVGSGSFTGSARTINAQPTEVLFNNARLTVPLNKSWFFTINAIGRRTNGTGNMAISREGVAFNNNGVISIPGGEPNRVIFNNNTNSAWDLAVSASGGEFSVKVTGEAGADILWSVGVTVLEA